MNARKLGALTVSLIGMGCMGLSHGDGDIPDRAYSVEAIRRAHGVTPLSAAQSIYSMVERGVVEAVIPLLSGKSHRFCPLFAHRQRFSLRQGHRKTGFFPQRRRSEIHPPAPTGKSGRQPAHSGPAGPLCPAEKCRQSPDLPQLDVAQIAQRRPHPRFQKSRTHFGKSGRVECRAHPRRVRRVGRRPGRDPCPRPPRLCGTAGRQHEKLGQKITHQKAPGQAGGFFYSSAAGSEDGAHRRPYIHVLNAWNCGANETGPVPRARRCAPAF